MTKLFELSQAYQALLDTEELTEEEVTLALDNVADLISNKALNIARLVISLQEEVGAIDNETKRLMARKISRENKVKSLKTYLQVNMEAVGIDKAKDNFVSVMLQNNPPSVALIDILQIPDKYWRVIPEQREVDKQNILANFKRTGEVVAGTEIITNKKHIVIR